MFVSFDIDDIIVEIAKRHLRIPLDARALVLDLRSRPLGPAGDLPRGRPRRTRAPPADHAGGIQGSGRILVQLVRGADPGGGDLPGGPSSR